jgi:hypothetical protein
MGMNKHTSGPWHVEPASYPERAHPQVYAGQKRIAQPCNSADVPAPESDYNAALIAAAPDLLDVLERIVYCLDSGIDIGPSTRKQARAALAKAANNE